MMKKLLKPTLGKKIFILLLVSFCFVNVLNILLDFSREKNHAYASLNDTYLDIVVNQLTENFQTLDDAFLQGIHKILNQERTDYKNVIILDKELNMIYNDQSQADSYFILSDTIEETDMTIDVSYIFHLSLLDQSIKNEIEKEIKKNFHNKPMKIKIASPTYSQVKDEHNGILISDISYLSIGDRVLFDQRKNQESIEELDFLTYENENIYLSLQQFYPWNEQGYHELNYQEIRNNIMENICDSLPIDTSNFYSFSKQFEKDNTLYSVECTPLIPKDNRNGNDFAGEVQGYFIYYHYDLYAIDRIMNDVLLSKIPAYVVSFVFVIILCLLLSYMLTKRIKKINQSALMIANNQFDVHLKEKPNDELGTLSHNINHMSERLKQTIEQLNDEIDRVKHLESLRKEFIANFTHEIKTPLGIINGYIELIEMSKDEEKKQKYLTAINQETDRINELVKSMLDLSRIEIGYVELHIQDIDIEDMLSSIIETFAPLLEKKQIKIIMDGEFSQIQADAQEISIVFKNFISNAIKHTPENGHIYIRFQDQTLMIENEGEHINDQQKEKIWDTYVSSDREGTGLGLAICKAILDLHEFHYYVDNTQKGVCFTIEMNKEES